MGSPDAGGAVNGKQAAARVAISHEAGERLVIAVQSTPSWCHLAVTPRLHLNRGEGRACQNVCVREQPWGCPRLVDILMVGFAPADEDGIHGCEEEVVYPEVPQGGGGW